MRAAAAKIMRENLFEEISNVLNQWPELERKVFSQAHYRGQSPEAISRSLQLGVEEVSTILNQCNRQLNASLRNFRENACPAACAEERPGGHPLDCPLRNIPDVFRIPA